LVTAGYSLFKAPTQLIEIAIHNSYAVRSPRQPLSLIYCTFLKDTHGPVNPPPCNSIRQKTSGNIVSSIVERTYWERSLLFLPRYALCTMSNNQVRNHFRFHQTWMQLLKSITMDPIISHFATVLMEQMTDIPFFCTPVIVKIK
jgi:hypothetical protein